MHVLKKVVMDAAKVDEIKLPHQGFLQQFQHPDSRGIGLKSIKRRLIPDVGLVPQYRRAGINVAVNRVVTRHGG